MIKKARRATRLTSHPFGHSALNYAINLAVERLKEAIAKLPLERRKIITTHDAFGYFGAAYGMAFIAPEGVSTESEASAKDVAKIIRQIKKEQRAGATRFCSRQAWGRRPAATRQSSFLRAEPLCIATCSVLSLLISY